MRRTSCSSAVGMAAHVMGCIPNTPKHTHTHTSARGRGVAVAVAFLQGPAPSFTPAAETRRGERERGKARRTAAGPHRSDASEGTANAAQERGFRREGEGEREREGERKRTTGEINAEALPTP